MAVDVHLYQMGDFPSHWARWEHFLSARRPFPLSRHPRWLAILHEALHHQPFCLEASDGQRLEGLLFLAHVRSVFFGRFLVSLPYLNYGGTVATSNVAAGALIDHALWLAHRLDVRYLELRQEIALSHPALALKSEGKVNMRLPLPASGPVLWNQLSAKVRNQIRKAQKGGFEVVWGSREWLEDFYSIFSRNMRDLGTPVYSRELFRAILDHFPHDAEMAVVRLGTRPVASGLCLHGKGICEVPSASVRRDYRPTNANMLLYWHLLQRAVERGQALFDFGRSTPGSPTYRFKKQWGALPEQTSWQYYLRQGSMNDMRVDNPRYQRLVRMWQRLPVGLTRLLGPPIVRGIP